MRDAVRSRLWPIPLFGVVTAVILGIAVPFLDGQVDGQLPGWLDAVLFNGDAGAARTVLDAVSSSLITVTALTFSLTVVTLQLASTQFSPRLLRTFTKDLFVQVTLAIFLATFTYSLTVLRSVRSSEDSSEPFVPRMAVSVSFLMAIASVIALVLFLAHLTRQIRVETMLANVYAEAVATARTTLMSRDEPGCGTFPAKPHDHGVLVAERSGFLLRVDEGKIIAAANEVAGLVMVQPMPGEFIVEGTPIAAAWRCDEAPLRDSDLETLRSAFRSAVHLGPERTEAQDVTFGLRQLVDVANKALSPGVNDPTTAVHALGHASALLCELARFRLGPVTRCDGEGTVRVQFARPSFQDCLDLALTQPRLYGASDPLVILRLLRLLRELAQTIPVEDLPTVLDHLDRMTHVLHQEKFDAAENSSHARLTAEIRSIAAARRMGGSPA
jgi:uncharacterized membrane protein